MTKKETIYNALGMIEGAVCVSQKNTREVLMKAIEMIKDAVEEKSECGCDHQYETKELYQCEFNNDGTPSCLAKRVCVHCGETEYVRV